MAHSDVNRTLKDNIKALLADPQNAAYARTVFEALALLDGYKLPASVIAVLSAWADHPTIDPAPLPRIARNVLMADARFAAFAQNLTDGDWLFNSPLLLAGLERATVNDEALEHLLTRIRRHVVVSQDFLSHYPRFVTALARQCIATRHIWAEQPGERDACAGHTVLRCLYEPLENLTHDEQARLPPLLASIHHDRTQEKELAQALPQLTAIDPGVSTAVKAQYENFPYPLWRDTASNTAMAWPEMIAQFVGATPTSVPRPATPEVLIAGCGTGRSTAMMASLLPAANILAVDLSRTSLGYAARQARGMNITNVKFGVADILRLGDLGRRFHLIECGGVLHHMAEHVRGLQILSNLLEPGGLLNLALYSERARAPIVAARYFVAEHKFSDDIVGMRAARTAIFALPADHPARRITRRSDFYSADGLHDLVFNTYEARFTPATLKPLIASSGLDFLGFTVARADRLAEYRAVNPHDLQARDLAAWDEFDKTYPDTFQGMFQMWLQRPA